MRNISSKQDRLRLSVQALLRVCFYPPVSIVPAWIINKANGNGDGLQPSSAEASCRNGNPVPNLEILHQNGILLDLPGGTSHLRAAQSKWILEPGNLNVDFGNGPTVIPPAQSSNITISLIQHERDSKRRIACYDTRGQVAFGWADPNNLTWRKVLLLTFLSGAEKDFYLLWTVRLHAHQLQNRCPVVHEVQSDVYSYYILLGARLKRSVYISFHTKVF